MGAKSKIEWTDASWNPIRALRLTDDGLSRTDGKLTHAKMTAKVGWHCEHVSEGCRFCYAERMNRRLGTGLDYKPGHRDDLTIGIDGKLLTDPLRWKKPRKIFVGSMTDLFADFVADEMLDQLLAVMALSVHEFQILTKRPDRMWSYVTAADVAGRIWTKASDHRGDPLAALSRQGASWGGHTPWPLRNVWLGTSCEDQETAAARIPHLLATPAAKRFLSCEPLLGPIDFDHILHERAEWLSAHLRSGETNRIDWLICGGESGPGARPMHPDWARSLRDQCAAAGVPFFFKQWGEHHPDGQAWADGTHGLAETPGEPIGFARVGKARAGRLLDGIEHNAFPATP